MALDDKIGNEKRGFTSEDFKQYLDRLKPYQEKVYEKKELLTLEEVEELMGMRHEIIASFDMDSSIDSKIFGYISAVRGRDDLRKTVLWEEELEREYKSLSKRLREGIEKGSITGQEKEAGYKRLNEISRELYPYR